MISNVDGAREKTEEDLFRLAPLINSEPLSINVASSRSGLVFVDHVDGCLVVFIENSRTVWRKTQFNEYRTEILGDLGSMDSCNEFGFGGRSRDCRLDFRLESNSTASKSKDQTSD